MIVVLMADGSERRFAANQFSIAADGSLVLNFAEQSPINNAVKQTFIRALRRDQWLEFWVDLEEAETTTTPILLEARA